jgi:hypothetical protein
MGLGLTMGNKVEGGKREIGNGELTTDERDYHG